MRGLRGHTTVRAEPSSYSLAREITDRWQIAGQLSTDQAAWPPSSPRGAQNAAMDTKTVNLTQALASFDEVYSPRIVAHVNDYDVKIAHARGLHLWHTHQDTDEFFLVLDGRFEITLRDADRSESTVTMETGDTFVVPRGVEHRPSSPGGSILMFEPAGTSSTGDSHEAEVPAHVDSTAGHELA
jgi:mannose-6-phosphate isomerase-like protein (cupin superfamily)